MTDIEPHTRRDHVAKQRLRFDALLLIGWLLVGVPGAATPAMSAPVMSRASTSWETSDSSVTLRGAVTTQLGVANVLWVSALGARGSGTWSSTGAHGANWTVTNVPLRLGANQITVIVTDRANNSSTAHYALHRVPIAGTSAPQSPSVLTGLWHDQAITYQLVNGHAVVEGDIVVQLDSITSSKSVAGKSPAAVIEPDGVSISYTAGSWPAVGGVHQVPYTLSGSSAALTTALSTFNQIFSGLIQFVPRTSQANYVAITVSSGGSGEGESNVGMVGGAQFLTCGGGCTVPTFLHEMGHTVGLYHEHQRPDRANFITLNLSNADLPNVPGNFTLFSFDYQTEGLYDYDSVMHYSSFDFSATGLPVLESIPAGIPLSNNVGYSLADIDTIERLYQATPSAVTVTTNPVGLQVEIDGTVYTTPKTFTWALNSTHALNLPADPQVTNPTDGSSYAFGVWNDQGARSHSITVTPGSGSLTAPASSPAVTVYEANFVRLQPFLAPTTYPSNAGTIKVTPTPTSEYGGTFFTDRTLVTLTLTSAGLTGYNFYGWDSLPYPPSDNPHQFYIQTPTTEGQAVFVPAPVTIIGESLTGPNTWNPNLYGTVDGAFYFLPTGFSSYYDGSTWAPVAQGGSTHPISVTQQTSPVTTNIFYNWNSWSDSGTISHSVSQVASGSQTITAAFTPYYASYTAPPPLNSSAPSCQGGIATSPAGVSYSQNTTFSFYADGTSVMTTATANSAVYAGMTFAGWGGSLSGATSPQNTVIHGQFVPTAVFNEGATPLTIAGLSPSSVAANGSTLTLTINGTGFLPPATNPAPNTYVYYNGSFRNFNYVNSTQLTVPLNAGDVATPGGQDLQVGNYLPNAGNTASCGPYVETSFTVTQPGATADATASFDGTDSVNEGTWSGKYGADGYLIANGANSLPSYATVSASAGASLYTWSASTTDPRALQTANGATSRIASTYYSTSTFNYNVNLTDGNTHQVALYLLDWDNTNRAETISVLDANSNAVLDSRTFSSFHNGEYASWNVKGHVLIQVTVTGGDDAVVSGLFFGPAIKAAATYNGADSATQGTWSGNYGTDGELIVNSTTNLPAYATVTPSGGNAYTWTSSTTDPRALQTTLGGSTRIAAAYYASGTMTYNVNLTDGNTHQVALYLLDWDNTNRAESISIVDATSNEVLDTENFSSLHNGTYASWNLSGHVLIEVSWTGGDNAVVSGLFFGPAATANSVSSGTFNGIDTATQGNWTGLYGKYGYVIANDAAKPPSYAEVNLIGDSTYTWASSTTDPRALQTASAATSRIASTFYASSGFSFNLNLTDGNTHQIALYLLDWDGTGRAETISILDAASGSVLSTQNFSGFHNGQYAKFNVQGHVIVQVQLSGGDNPVVSGLFFD